MQSAVTLGPSSWCKFDRHSAMTVPKLITVCRQLHTSGQLVTVCRQLHTSGHWLLCVVSCTLSDN